MCLFYCSLLSCDTVVHSVDLLENVTLLELSYTLNMASLP